MTVSDHKPGYKLRTLGEEVKWQGSGYAPDKPLGVNSFKGVIANAEIKGTARRCENDSLKDNLRCFKAKGRQSAGQIMRYFPFLGN